ncbi:hypothetical protein GGS26DRAFT_378722 [Hypomontagnella submonticulosa]|nr:hypothetical protein GGS26DRAFT_378722 [Hypomontagnella submonticulosa]
MVKRKLSPNLSQGWAAFTGSFPRNGSISGNCHANLISIAEAIHAANVQYKDIVSQYLRWRRRASSSQTPERFDQHDLDVMTDITKARLPLTRPDIPRLLENLSETSYIGIWERANENMAYLRGHWTHQRQKHQDKGTARAIEIRRCRVVVEDGLNLVKKELRALGHNDARDGILAKLSMLQKYEEAYPIAPQAQRGFLPNLQMPVLVFLSILFTSLGFIPAAVAISKSTNEVGSLEDSDFYMLIQSVIIQFLGLITAVYTVHQRSAENRVAWYLAISLAAWGIICGVASIPLYLYWPTIWSGVASCCASVAQAGVTLELAMITEHAKLKQS